VNSSSRKQHPVVTDTEIIHGWLLRGVAQKARYVVIACDTFDNNDYPIFAANDEECRVAQKCHNEFKRIMEVYDLQLPIAAQLAEHRAMHGPLEKKTNWAPGRHEVVLAPGATMTEIEVEWCEAIHECMIPINGVPMHPKEFGEKYPDAVVVKVEMKCHQCFCHKLSKPIRSDLKEVLKIRDQSGFKPAMGPEGGMIWMCLECYEKIQIHFESIATITGGMEFSMSSFVSLRK